MTLDFRTKLLLAMMGLVAAVTAAILLITENQVRRSYERHFKESFQTQLQTFLERQRDRLAPVKERVAEGATTPRVIAAMQNAGLPTAEQQDVDDLYKNGVDYLMDGLKTYQGTNTGFFFFLNRQGQVLDPSPAVQLPFALPGLRRITPQIEKIGKSVIQEGRQQTGHLAPREEGEPQIREMLFTPLTDEATRQQLGVLVVGFPMPELMGERRSAGQQPKSEILSAIWLDDQLYSAAISGDDLARLEHAFGRELQAGRKVWDDFIVHVQGRPHQLFSQDLSAGSAFPPAYQICLYSLADADAEKASLRRKVLLTGLVALMAAWSLGLMVSRGLTRPLRELVVGTEQVEQGNYDSRVPVRSRDEVGRLTEAFNQMTERVHAAHAAQVQRLGERTQELAERKRAEEALRQSERSLREAQRIAHLGNWHWNVVANQLRWSDQIYSIFALEPRQFAGTYEAFLERVHPDDRTKVGDAVTQALKNGQPYNLEHRVTRPGGEVRIVQERAEVIRDAAGQALEMAGTVQDVTEQKRIEAEFFRAQRLDSIGALAAGMAHDLNNALSPILMGIQLFRRQWQDPAAQRMLSAMEASTHRGADLVRQVLTFARGSEGDRERFDLARLLREIEAILRQTLPKSITVASIVPKDLWPVLGNPTQLHQVLLNLCVNARDAMPKGGELTLAADNVQLSAAEAQTIPQATPGDYVNLLVSDTGTGIAPDVLPRIFDPFFTTKAPGKGTGLGLSTITRIVRSHGGFLTLKSELGSGTTFEVYLPRAEVALAPAQATVAVPLAAGGGELVLLVDDDRSVREMVGPTLIDHGYRVLSAADGAEALALFERHAGEVTLVLTDLEMPVMDGPAMLRAVRARCPTLPVIIMSGELDALDGVSTHAVLRKPFRLEQLLAAIASALPSRAPRI
jgi:PAS domain S-box-containing protein